jgi:hypothetical protein
MDRDRDRDRIHARERDMVHYDINDEDLMAERGGYPTEYSSDRGGGTSSGRGRGAGGDDHLAGASQHHSRHNDADGREMLRERERDPRDRDPRDRERELRERERIIAGSSEHRERDRYPPQQMSRRGERERDEFSPHRSGGNSRRVLNAM